MELERFPDGKSVYIDPVLVCAVEPDDEAVGVSQIRLYSLGGVVRVLGSAEENALLVQRARQMVSEVGIEALVEIVREEVKLLEHKKRNIN
jgi:hypothetical protein